MALQSTDIHPTELLALQYRPRQDLRASLTCSFLRDLSVLFLKPGMPSYSQLLLIV